MGETTGIEWTHHTFNPWLGCSKVSPACAHCYAEVNRAVMAASSRVKAPLWGPDTARVKTSDAYWKQPERWNRAAAKAGERRRVFCASLADVFEDRQDLDRHRSHLFEMIFYTPHLDWLLLTKRPENILELADRAWEFGVEHRNVHLAPLKEWSRGGQPFPNVWIGTTAENQERADERIPHLLRVPARVRFLSCEPLLGPIELPRYIRLGRPVGSDPINLGDPEEGDHKFAFVGGAPVAARAGIHRVHLNRNGARSVEVDCGECGGKGCPGDPYPCRGGRTFLGIKPDECEDLGFGIDWVIAGGESGPEARPMHPDWACALRDQCSAASVPFFFKQWGEFANGSVRGEPGFSVLNDGSYCAFTREACVELERAHGGRWFEFRPTLMSRVGKKSAGAFLDGDEHRAFPVVAS